jgi:hypothetical protein
MPVKVERVLLHAGAARVEAVLSAVGAGRQVLHHHLHHLRQDANERSAPAQHHAGSSRGQQQRQQQLQLRGECTGAPQLLTWPLLRRTTCAAATGLSSTWVAPSRNTGCLLRAVDPSAGPAAGAGRAASLKAGLAASAGRHALGGCPDRAGAAAGMPSEWRAGVCTVHWWRRGNAAALAAAGAPPTQQCRSGPWVALQATAWQCNMTAEQPGWRQLRAWWHRLLMAGCMLQSSYLRARLWRRRRPLTCLCEDSLEGIRVLEGGVAGQRLEHVQGVAVQRTQEGLQGWVGGRGRGVRARRQSSTGYRHRRPGKLARIRRHIRSHSRLPSPRRLGSWCGPRC